MISLTPAHHDVTVLLTERVELQTQRLLLRPWRLSDVDDAFTYASDPDWARYLWDVPHPYTREDAEEFVRSATERTWSKQAQFAIIKNGKPIGGVHIYIADEASKICGLGYNVGRIYWGQGIATEAARVVLDFGFRVFEPQKVLCKADARNLESLKVMQKLGMTQEALLRKHRLFRGEYIDEVWFGILREEWRVLDRSSVE